MSTIPAANAVAFWRRVQVSIARSASPHTEIHQMTIRSAKRSFIGFSVNGCQSNLGCGGGNDPAAHNSRFCGVHRFALVEIGPRVDGAIVKEGYGFRWAESIPSDLIPEGFGLVLLTWGLKLLLSPPTEDVVSTFEDHKGDVAEPSDKESVRDDVDLNLEIDRDGDHLTLFGASYWCGSRLGIMASPFRNGCRTDLLLATRTGHS